MNQNSHPPSSASPTGHSTKRRGVFYGLVTAIPVVGDAVRIANSYVFDGDYESDICFAPPRLWVKKHFSTLVITCLLTLISTPPSSLRGFLNEYLPAVLESMTSQNPAVPGALIVSIFPNLLGFGIGVYALIFSLSSILVNRIEERIKPAKNEAGVGSALVLNADMAYPLLMIALSLGIGVLQLIFSGARTLEILAWGALWYSMLMALEILTALFGLGEHELLEKLKRNAPTNPD